MAKVTKLDVRYRGPGAPRIRFQGEINSRAMAEAFVRIFRRECEAAFPALPPAPGTPQPANDPR